MKMWDDIYNYLFNNKEWLFSGIGVVVITFIVAKIFTTKKRKIKFTFSFIASFEQIGDQFGPTIPMIFSNIVNVGNIEIFIENPVVITGEKINGHNMFQMLEVNSNHHFPIRLSPGEKIELKYNSLSLDKYFFSQMKGNSYIKFMTTDTFNKEYYSPKLFANKISEHNKLIKINN